MRERWARAAARLLPGPAVDALRGPARRLRLLPPVPAGVRARELLREGDLDAAGALATEALARRPDDRLALLVAVDVAAHEGRLTDAHSLAVRLAAVDDRLSARRRARLLEGTLRDLDPAWSPAVRASLAPGDRTGVLYLAKESLPWRVNGFTRRSHETLRALARAGVAVTCLTVPGFPGEPDADDATEVDGVLYRHQLPRAGLVGRALPRDEQVALTARLLALEVERLRPAVLHAASGHRGFETAVAVDAVARATGTPWVYELRSFFETSWTRDPLRWADAEASRLRHGREAATVRSAPVVVTLSNGMAHELVAEYGADPRRLVVAPNGVDVGRLQPQPRDEALRTAAGLRGLVVGYVSSVAHPREGHALLVEALARLRADGHDVSLLLVGDGPLLDDLRKQAQEAGVAEHLVAPGAVPPEEVARWYAQIDVFVVPRVDERAARLVTPLKPFEAMAFGVPVVVSNLPALREIAGDDEQRAVLFAPGDVAALTAAVLRVAHDSELRGTLVDSAGRWVREERTWDGTAAALMSAYDMAAAQTVTT